MADPILLSLFANRFMSVAEAMGRTLQQTSISTNIKERLDFSCAIFAPNGDLVANAPHLPVHLGSMSFSVRYQINLLGEDIHEGDVLNVGGILPGSMPPTSKTIFEEGAQIKSFKLVKKGVYQREELVRYLIDEPAKYPGCSGTRCLSDVESDLKAQIGANWKGVKLIEGMIDEFGLETVQEYMLHIRDNAALAVRNLLKQVARERGTTLMAEDFLDDGSPIRLKINIDEQKGEAVFDFEGTGEEMIGNLNAPISVVYSAVIYCLRCLVDLDIPLNQGCLVPINIKIPPGTLLSPSDTAAVVGGNVCTSQRITDVVLKAFEACAASQGDCNNLTFGMGGNSETGEYVAGWGYYETIAGGSGAGPTWDGTSGVHTHMTNTRITDPEIFERRYPIILRQFSLRDGSAGQGLHRGGEGVIRDIEFLEPIQCSILSERRVYSPYGLKGGSNGERGQNLWVKKGREEDGDAHVQGGERIINLGGKQTVRMGKGDRIIVKTPGGGGWGVVGGDRSVREHLGNWEPRGSWTERRGAQEGA